ncbi:MAG: MaoC/PaaZ C-terminal domain-containing protein [Microthrixaceae bacterium]
MTLDEVATACPIALGQSAPLLITQEMVDTHASTTGDAQWIHNDPERAIRESPFGAPIVQGFLLLALLTQLSSDLKFPSYGQVSMLLNYGFDRVRFLQAVPVGSSVFLVGTLSQVRIRPDNSAVLSIDVELCVESTQQQSQGLEPEPSMSARWLFLAIPSE